MGRASFAVGRVTFGGNGVPRRRASHPGVCARCQGVGVADGPPGRRGQSAGQIRFVPETMLSLVSSQVLTADSPLLESGQSALEIDILSRDDVVSGHIAGLNRGRSAIGERTVRSRA